MNLRRFFLVFVLLLAAPAFADTSVNPTVWHVKGPAGDAYLLGSIHILPPNVDWHSQKIAAAVGASDVFVFEVPLDAQSTGRLQALVAEHGFLPQDQTLRGLLHSKYRKNYDAAVAVSGVDPAALSHQRPWLAGLTMMFAEIGKLKFDPSNGPDTVLMREAQAQGKGVRYLETMEDQFAVLAPSDPDMDRDEFEAGLGELRDVGAEIQPMVDAWGAGDQKKLDELVNGDLDTFPAARKALLDDRNARWLPQIEAMLKEKHTFFITVGAGHLTGPKGVPALLRKAGYKVDN
jgi:uncharacterized protein YbaP (TraB family)